MINVYIIDYEAAMNIYAHSKLAALLSMYQFGEEKIFPTHVMQEPLVNATLKHIIWFVVMNN